MSMLRCDNCSLDMKVRLTNPDKEYDIGPNNPVVGSKWECDGKVVSYTSSNICVRWVNGAANDYKNNELSPLEGNDYISIW